MSTQNLDSTVVIDQALEWIERLRAGNADHEGFFDWLTESPRHVEVFMQAMTLEQRIANLLPQDWAHIENTTNVEVDVDLQDANVVPLRPAPYSAPRLSRRNVKWRTAAVAASLAVIGLLGWLLIPGFNGAQHFATGIGEQRVIRLDDGSLANLNTGTRIEVRMSAKARDIRLIEGEALFKVHRDPARPFRVHAQDVVIQALGTQFNVYRRTTGTTVSVLEGRVEVIAAKSRTAHPDNAAGSTVSKAPATPAPAALSAGEQADISPSGVVERRTKLSSVHPTAWQQRRLIFDEEQLAHIVFEFNRYNRRQFRVDDAAAASWRFSGIFDVDDPDSLAQLLARDGRLEVEHEGRETVIRAK